jgi:hypothetical protein
LTLKEAALGALKLRVLKMVLAVLAVGVVAGVHLSAQNPPSATAGLNDRGTFEISSGGVSLGTESFEIRSTSAQIEAQSEVHLSVEQNGKKLEVRTNSTLRLDSHFNPLTYTWSQKGAQSSQLSMDFHNQPVSARYKTVDGHDDRRDFKLDPDVLILDDNTNHHYQLAVARYDFAKGGTQEFRAFIPQEAAPGILTMKLVGPEPVTLNGQNVTLRHFLLTAQLAQVDLWVDDQGHLQIISAAQGQYQATRKK